MMEIKPGHYYDIDGHEADGARGDVIATLCRRLSDFGPGKLELPATGAVTWCVLCHASVVFNPNGPHLDAPRVCLQCVGIEPLNP